MVSSGWGRVVNVSSAVAMQPNNLGSDYSGAKAALNNFTVSLAGSLKSSGVTINTVTPGVVFTDAMFRWGHAKLGPDATQQQIAQAMSAAGMFDLPPVGRLGTPEDIALIVTTLASPLSGYVTGSNYRVDGGQIRTV
jgi:NAD(P)-dependent dehydrogenase (short-subunit alcohol dehydrogenase family)